MITIVKQKKRLIKDRKGKAYYKDLIKMIELNDCEITEHSAMKRYGEPNLKSRVEYLNKYKGYNIERLKRPVIIDGRRRLHYWYEQIEQEAA